MKKNLLPLLLLAATTLFAQTTPAPSPTIKCPSTATLDELTTAIYAAVTGPADQDRTCFRDIFTPDARLIPNGKAADGTVHSRVLTVDDWINAVAKRGHSSFFEKQIKAETTTWANIAHIWSTYETREGTPDSKPTARGINSIQAINDGTRWHAIEIIWQAETPDNQVPAKFLP